MKRFFSLLILLVLVAGCATTRAPQKDQVGADAKQADVLKGQDTLELKKAFEAFEKGMEAYRKGMDQEAIEAFSLALRHLRAANREGSSIMDGATREMEQIASISAFKYVPDEAFKLFILYQEMQNSYASLDYVKLGKLKHEFSMQVRKVRAMTAQAKQRRLKILSEEVNAGMHTLKKEHAGALEMYPKIYVVKPGDTLPGIAARHEIYNDSYMWPLIYKANRDQIKDPMVIYVGQDLKIPRDITVDEIIEARREAGAPEPEKIPSGAYIPKKGG